MTHWDTSMSVSTIGVIGAGVMGSGIAQVAATKGISLVSAESIVASNTSSVSITKLASSMSHPQRFVGLHFFNPVPVMSLVEMCAGWRPVMRHEAAAALAAQLGKTPFVLAEGYATAEDIDKGMKLGCNHPIGPLALADMIGLDVLLSVMQVLHDEFADSKYRPCPLLKELMAAGHLGRKSGRGVFSY
jgi:3-hydroxybutyryl-CoA dehydrogenase